MKIESTPAINEIYTKNIQNIRETTNMSKTGVSPRVIKLNTMLTI